MKSLIKFIILFFILSLVTSNKIKAQWFQVSQIPGLILLQISVADSNVVWLTGVQSSVLKMYRSTNGGLSWDSIPRFPSVYPINAPILSVIDSTTAFCIFAKADPIVRGSAFYKTTNSGQEWIFIDSIVGPYYDIGFSKSTPNVGVVFAWIGGTSYYKTVDTGNSWSIESKNFGSPRRYNPMFIIDEDFFGYIYEPNHNGDLGAKITSNGGTNWNQSYDQTGLGTGIAFNDDKLNGIMTSSSTEDNVFSTTNGGLNWNVLTTGVPLTPMYWDPIWIHGTPTVFLSSSAGIIRSDNNGSNFTIQELPSGVGLRKKIDYCKYGNKIIAYGVCFNGIIIKSRQEIIITNLQTINQNVPSEYNLFQNYPNPFNPVTKIKFDIPSNVKGQTSDVKLIIYNLLGKEVNMLVNKKLSAGSYEVEFEGSNFSSGIYFYKLTSRNFIETKKMLLIK